MAPLLCLAVGLACVVIVFGDGTGAGPAQIILIMAGLIAYAVGHAHGTNWTDHQDAVGQAVLQTLPAIYILLAIGTLIGIWVQAGVIPAMIVYGAAIVSLKYFFLCALLFCATVSLCIGSSWTTIGTVGIGLVGIAQAADISLSLTAGAVVSGAYFGDKLSPLSDTTNLAAGLSGAELFSHIRNLLWTTIPAFCIAILFFVCFEAAPSDDVMLVADLRKQFGEHFTFSPFLLVPVVVLFGAAILKIPAFLAIVASSVAALALIPLASNGAMDVSKWLKVSIEAAALGPEFSSSNSDTKTLLNRGGMSTMLPTIWLILCAMFLSGMMEASGCLHTLLRTLKQLFSRGHGLLLGAGFTSLATNIVAADQYLSLVITSRLFAKEAAELGYHPTALSRVVEDFGTVTSPLIPWNTCGLYIAATLGVSTLTYAPYALFNLASPVISLLCILTGFTIARR